ncbi:hypothetical protein Dfri01_66410 [Dyadobacter frigoris]|nr:hypothetical protein Dfri01_66410 [Dyadobacter frigoris]
MTLSCKSEENQKQNQLIVGEWTLFKEELNDQRKIDSTNIPGMEMGYKSGYTFREGGFCENKLGYHKDMESNDHKFLGTETKYRIHENRLEIYDLTNQIWEGYEVLKLDNKILKLALNDSVNVIYERSRYKLDPEIPFDQIIVSSSGCYGVCQINDVMVSRNGEVIFNNEQYTKKTGLFSSFMNLKEFDKAETKFRKANLKMLKDRYMASWTDDNEITISLVRNGRIYKTISDYGSQSPTELYWAYLPITYLDQKLRLKSLPHSKFYKTRISSFEKENKLIRLAKSESFYLTDLLNKADRVNTLFVEKYTLRAYGEQGSLKITTDGRYFKMRLKNGKFTILDLGYDFLKENDLLKRLSDKLDYEK